MAAQEHLFVYGTLLAQSGHEMARLLDRHATKVGEGRIQARLYIIHEIDDQGPNSYPAAVPSPHNRDVVHGMLYRLDTPDDVLPVFDEFEACTPGWPEPYEFLRRPIDVTLADGTVTRAACYLYTWDTSRATPVPSGRITEAMPDAR